MSAVETRDPAGSEVTPSTWMDRMLDEWIKAFPPARAFGLHRPGHDDDLIRVDEFQDGEVRVIRADLPGVDPATDVEITVAHGLLHINAQRRMERDVDDRDVRRHEIRYGSLTRTLPLPPGPPRPTSRRPTGTGSWRSGFRSPGRRGRPRPPRCR